MTADPWVPPWSLEIGMFTDVGRVRQRNEDAAKVSSMPGLLCVADGMGGHRGGDRASSLAVEALHEYVRRAREDEMVPGEELLDDAFATANRIVLEEATQNEQYQGMGTTLTAILFAAEGAYAAHIGDSRAYRIRGGAIKQLTLDHSLVAEQVREGAISEEEAKVHPSRHVLSRVLGFKEDVTFDTFPVEIEANDIFVLSSDGLIRGVEAEEIGEIVAAAQDSQDAAERLVATACERDGGDNITVVVAACRSLSDDTLAINLEGD